MTSQMKFTAVDIAVTDRAITITYEWTGETPRQGPVYWGTVFKGSRNRVGKTLGFKLVDSRLAGLFVSDMSTGAQRNLEQSSYTPPDQTPGKLRIEVASNFLEDLGDNVTWEATMTIWQHDQDSRTGSLGK